MLTDTTFWIDLSEERRLRRPGPASALFARTRPQNLSVSVVTWGELGVGYADLGALEALLHRIKIHFLPLPTAWRAAQLERQLRRAGLKLGENDNWIAATALSLGLRLVTNDGDYQRVPGLTVVTY